MSWRHAGTRALVAFGTLVFVLIFNFFLFRAVGDPKKDLIRSRLSPAARQAVIRERGLDKDKLTQFRIYIRQTLSGDLGTSTNSRKAVWDELMAALPNTLILTGIAGNFCVLFTAHDAYMRDFKLVVPRDCLASEKEADNRNALEHMAATCKAEIGPSTAIDFARLRKAA